MFVREIMSMKVEWATPDMTLRDAARRMREKNIGCLVVESAPDGALAGIVTDRDITCRATAEGADPMKTTVADVMSKDAAFCFDDQDVAAVAPIMETKKIHRLPVMDHDRRVVGLLSLTDIALRGSQALSGEVLKAVSRYAMDVRAVH